MSDLLESWVRGQDKVLEQTSLKKIVQTVNSVLNPAFGHIHATDFHSGHVQDWVDSHALARKTTSEDQAISCRRIINGLCLLRGPVVPGRDVGLGLEPLGPPPIRWRRGPRYHSGRGVGGT